MVHIRRFVRCTALLGVLFSLVACQTSDGRKSTPLPFGGKTTFSEPYKISQSKFNGYEFLNDFNMVHRSDRSEGTIFTEYYFQGFERTTWIGHHSTGRFTSASTDVVLARKRFVEYLNAFKLPQLIEHTKYLEFPDGRGHIADDGKCGATIFAKRLKPLMSSDSNVGLMDTTIYSFSCVGYKETIKDLIQNLELN
jgi:hypothetical protein